MAEAIYWYGNGLRSAILKKYDYSGDTIKVMLVSDSYTPNQDDHDYKDDVVSYEVSATGYTAGGATLANKTYAITGGSNVLTLDADDTSWSITGSMTARYAVIYDATPSTDATRPLLGYYDFDSNKTVTDALFKITWPSDGILKITYS
jgi:hypothetical protein